MKRWKEYSEYLETGEWHIHTGYTDGKNTIDEYCARATQLGVPLVAFTEHVRRELSYDFEKFLSEIEAARERYDLIILSGCEAKVLPDGTLDVEERILKRVDYPVFAFHSFPSTQERLVSALRTSIRNPYMNAWAHPSTFFNRWEPHDMSAELDDIFEILHQFDVLFEINKKYDDLPPLARERASTRRGGNVRGSDCHSIEQLIRAGP